MPFMPFLLFFFLLFISGCSGPEGSGVREDRRQESGSPESLFRIAQSMRETGDYATAIKMYRKVLSLDPHFYKASFKLGQTYQDVGRHQEAMQIYQDLLKKGVGDLETQKALGKIYISTNKANLGISIFKKLLQKTPKDITILNGLGICHDILGDAKKAQMWYQKALEIYPHNKGIESNLGLSFTMDGNYTKGIAILSRIANQPDATARDRQNLAMAYGLAGDMEKASKFFSIDLDQFSVRNNIAYLHLIKPSPINPQIGSQARVMALQNQKPEPMDIPIRASAAVKTAKNPSSSNTRTARPSKVVKPVHKKHRSLKHQTIGDFIAQKGLLQQATSHKIHKPSLPVASPPKRSQPIRIQLASLRSQEAANKTWAILSQTHTPLSNLKKHVEKVNFPQGEYHRLQAGNFKTPQEAENMCNRLKQRGLPGCFVVNPAP